jgi:tetratricopeptide (TPR) repeat protein
VIAELRTAVEGRVWNIARYLAIAAHSLEGAEQLLELLTEPTRPAEVRAFGNLALAHLDLARGRARTAAARLDQASSLDPISALQHRALVAMVPFLPAQPDYLVALRDSIAQVRPSRAPPSLETSHLANLHDVVHEELRGYLAAGLSLRLGDTATARNYLGELETPGRTHARATVARDATGSIRAQLARRTGRASDAARDLEEVLRLEARVGLIGGSPFYSQGLERFLYAGVLAGEGRPQDANLWYDSFSSNSIFDLIYLAPSHLERGRIAEKLGQPRVALSHYQQAVALWLNCDPDLRALPEEARARIKALKVTIATKGRDQRRPGILERPMEQESRLPPVGLHRALRDVAHGGGGQRPTGNPNPNASWTSFWVRLSSPRPVPSTREP